MHGAPQQKLDLMEQQQTRRRSIAVLSSDDLLRIFSCLAPRSLARCSMVCKSWNHSIKISSLWQMMYYKYRRRLKAICNEDIGLKLGFQIIERETVADWEAQFVREQHRALIVCGSVMVRDWKGHSGRVECCRMRMGAIVTGSSDRTIRVWSATTSRCLETYITPNKSPVVDLEFDENKIIAIAGTEVCIWSRGRGRLLRRIGGHNQRIYSMCYADPDIFVGCADGTIRIFDLYSSRCTHIFRQHTGHVSCIIVDADSSLLASGSADGTVQLCDAMSGQKITCLLPPSPPVGVSCLHLHYDQYMLMGGTTSGQIYGWDIRYGFYLLKQVPDL